jgi:hypothetical protein
MEQCTSPSLYAARSIAEVRKVASWVDQLMEMDESMLSDWQLDLIARKWHRRSPEAPEMILERMEASLITELGLA